MSSSLYGYASSNSKSNSNSNNKNNNINNSILNQPLMTTVDESIPRVNHENSLGNYTNDNTINFIRNTPTGILNQRRNSEFNTSSLLPSSLSSNNDWMACWNRPYNLYNNTKSNTFNNITIPKLNENTLPIPVTMPFSNVKPNPVTNRISTPTTYNNNNNNNNNNNFEFIPPNQMHTPTSSVDYQSNISDSTINSRRASLMYPPTPQTSSSVHSYKNNFFNNNYNNNFLNINNNNQFNTQQFNNHNQFENNVNTFNKNTINQSIITESVEESISSLVANDGKDYYDLTEGIYVKLNDMEASNLLINKRIIPIDLSESSNEEKNVSISNITDSEKQLNKRKSVDNGDNKKSVKKCKTDSFNKDSFDNDDDDEEYDDYDSNDSNDKNNEHENDVVKKNKRSRGGCLTCRKRKIRCCETKPICTECQRTKMKCRWPVPGYERKNKSRTRPLANDEVYHEVYGRIKVLRGVVEYSVEE